MLSANIKLYLALFFVVSSCLVQISAAPAKESEKGEPELAAAIFIFSEDDTFQTTAAADDSDATTVSSTDATIAQTVDPNSDYVLVPSASLQTPEDKLSSSDSDSTHVRVKRNKTPIRYHAKNIKRKQ